MESLGFPGALRVRWRLIVAVTVIGASLALVAPPPVGSFPSARTLEEVASPAHGRYASTAVIGTPPNAAAATSPLGTQAGGQFATLVFYLRHAQVMENFGVRIGYTGDDRSVLTRIVSIAPDPQTGVINVTSFGGTRQQAVDHTDAFIGAARDFLSSLQKDVETGTREEIRTRVRSLSARLERLTAAVDRLRKQNDDKGPLDVSAQNEAAALEARYRAALAAYGTAYDRLIEVQNTDAAPVTQFLVLDPPTLTSTQEKRPSLVYSVAFRLAVGALVGLLLGFALALLLEHLNRKISTRQEAEAALGVPVLAQLPRQRTIMASRKVRVLAAPGSALDSAHRMLLVLLLGRLTSTRTNTGGRAVFFDEQDITSLAAAGSEQRSTPVRSISPASAVGRSTSAQVLLLCSVANEPSYPAVVANVVSGLASTCDQVALIHTGTRNLVASRAATVPDKQSLASTVDVTELQWPRASGRSSLPTLVAKLSGEHAIVVVAAGAVASAEFSEAAGCADGALIVCEYRRTRIPDAERAAELVHLAGSRLIGAAMSQVPSSRADGRSKRSIIPTQR